MAWFYICNIHNNKWSHKVTNNSLVSFPGHGLIPRVDFHSWATVSCHGLIPHQSHSWVSILSHSLFPGQWFHSWATVSFSDKSLIFKPQSHPRTMVSFPGVVSFLGHGLFTRPWSHFQPTVLSLDHSLTSSPRSYPRATVSFLGHYLILRLCSNKSPTRN